MAEKITSFDPNSLFLQRTGNPSQTNLGSSDPVSLPDDLESMLGESLARTVPVKDFVKDGLPENPANFFNVSISEQSEKAFKFCTDFMKRQIEDLQDLSKEEREIIEAIKQGQNLENLANKYKTQIPGLNQAKWVRKNLAPWVKVHNELAKNETKTNLDKFKNETRKVFKELCDRTFRLASDQKRSYTECLEELLGVLELNEDGKIEEDARLALTAVEHLILVELIHKELRKAGIISSYESGDMEFGLLIKAKSKKESIYGTEILRDFFIPLEDIQCSKFPAALMHDGKVAFNVFNFANQVPIDFLQTQQAYNDLKEFFDKGGKISFLKEPQYLAAFMYALNYATKQNRDGDELDCFREHEKLYLEEAIQRNICTAAEMAYALSAKEARPDRDLIKFGARPLLLGDGVGKILKEDTYVADTFNKLSDLYAIDEDYSNLYKDGFLRLPHDFVDLKATLHAISKTGQIADFISDITGVVVPYPNATPLRLKKDPDGYPNSLVQVLMTRMLTEELIDTEENKLSEKVDWEALLEMDFTNQTVTQFLKDWNAYRKDPGSFEDQNGLMQLREAWYKFFDDNIADFSKARKLLREQKIQKAATRLLDKYFLTTKQKTRANRGWQEYFKEDYLRS